MVHVEDQVRGQDFFHQVMVHTVKVKGTHKALDHAAVHVVLRNVVKASFPNPEKQAHETRHASDEVQGVFLPVARRFHHA